jgi:hypothetical protein
MLSLLLAIFFLTILPLIYFARGLWAVDRDDKVLVGLYVFNVIGFAVDAILMYWIYSPYANGL